MKNESEKREMMFEKAKRKGKERIRENGGTYYFLIRSEAL